MNPPDPVLFVSWQSPTTRSIHQVGRLIRHRDPDLYEFVYIEKVRDAVAQGFHPFLEFPDLEQVYFGEELFPLFINRVLPRNRPEFVRYMDELGLSTSTLTPLQILARTGGRRETDRIELFPLPLPNVQTGQYLAHCLIRGIRHMPIFAERRIARLEPNERLLIFHDVQNEVDPTAIGVRSRDCVHIGYLPAYLAKNVHHLGDSCPQLEVFVERVNSPSAGYHHRLLCRIEGCWPLGFLPFSADDYRPISPEATDLRRWLGLSGHATMSVDAAPSA